MWFTCCLHHVCGTTGTHFRAAYPSRVHAILPPRARVRQSIDVPFFLFGVLFIYFPFSSPVRPILFTTTALSAARRRFTSRIRVYAPPRAQFSARADCYSLSPIAPNTTTDNTVPSDGKNERSVKRFFIWMSDKSSYRPCPAVVSAGVGILRRPSVKTSSSRGCKTDRTFFFTCLNSVSFSCT